MWGLINAWISCFRMQEEKHLTQTLTVHWLKIWVLGVECIMVKGDSVLKMSLGYYQSYLYNGLQELGRVPFNMYLQYQDCSVLWCAFWIRDNVTYVIGGNYVFSHSYIWLVLWVFDRFSHVEKISFKLTNLICVFHGTI